METHHSLQDPPIPPPLLLFPARLFQLWGLWRATVSPPLWKPGLGSIARGSDASRSAACQ